MKLISVTFMILSASNLIANYPLYNHDATQRLIHLFSKNPTEAIKNPQLKNLILEGADANADYCNKTTPLFYAVGNHDYELCEFLLAHGAHVNAQNEGGSTPLIWATLFGGNREIAELLIKNGANVQPVTHNLLPLLFAAANGNLEICELLLSNGADINAVSGGTTALGIAALMSVNYEEVCCFLLKKGAKVNLQNENGATMLMSVAFEGKVAMCELFLDHGADVNLKDKDGFTALIISCNPKSLFSSPDKLAAVTKVLLEHGAQVNAANNSGETALHLAAGHGLVKATQLLLAHGADPRAENKEGETPMSLAKKYNRHSLIVSLR